MAALQYGVIMTTTAERNDTAGPEGAYFLNGGSEAVSPAHAAALAEVAAAAETAANMENLAE